MPCIRCIRFTLQAIVSAQPVRHRRERVLGGWAKGLGSEALHQIAMMALAPRRNQRRNGRGVLARGPRAGADVGLAQEAVIGHQRLHRPQFGRQRAQLLKRRDQLLLVVDLLGQAGGHDEPAFHIHRKR